MHIEDTHRWHAKVKIIDMDEKDISNRLFFIIDYELQSIYYAYCVRKWTKKKHTT
jgi:hypothetical protein